MNIANEYICCVYRINICLTRNPAKEPSITGNWLPLDGKQREGVDMEFLLYFLGFYKNKNRPEANLQNIDIFSLDAHTEFPLKLSETFSDVSF